MLLQSMSVWPYINSYKVMKPCVNTSTAWVTGKYPLHTQDHQTVPASPISWSKYGPSHERQQNKQRPKTAFLMGSPVS